MLGPSLHAYRTRLPIAKQYALDLAWEQITAPSDWARTLCFASDYQRELWRTVNDPWLRSFKGMEQPTAVTGSPMMDAFGVPSIKPTARRHYVLVMALKFPADSGLWRRIWYKHVGYAALLQSVRRFCNSIGADLVVKTRAKNRDPWWLAGLADRVVVDTDLWPYTAAHLVRDATMVIHFQSGAALEAAFCSTPQLSVHLPHPHLTRYPAHREVYEASPGMQDWPGVVTGMGWETAVGYLDELAALGAVDATARAAYVQKFLGHDDCKTSQRILDLVEAGT